MEKRKAALPVSGKAALNNYYKVLCNLMNFNYTVDFSLFFGCPFR